MTFLAISALAVAGVARANPIKPTIATDLVPTKYTATVDTVVYDAQATAPTSPFRKHYKKGRAFDRFITIWMENTDYDKAEADPNLAWLAERGITLENYFGVTHPSEPNYVASHGGDNFGMDNDAFNRVSSNVSTITDLLEDKHISWGSYQEDIPYTGFEGYSWVNQETRANDYVRKHNPPVIYDANTSPLRLSYQKNMTEFYKDLSNEDLPQWMFITPNMTSDGHDTSVTVAGTWMRNLLEPLMENEYFWSRTLILVTFDENESYSISNRVFSVLLGGAVPKDLEGSKDDKYYNHYSELSTVEANWNLHTLGRWDVGANVFDLVACETGDIYRPNLAATAEEPTIFYNSSFAGPFNEDFQSAPYSPPNLDIKSPMTHRTVLPAIKKQWKGHTEGTYYHDRVEIPDGQHPPEGYAVNDVNNA
ncbi:acid phosphatase phoa [Hortaea werneckii]|uniref:Acid phosphatase n=1 Tax=Hortaea werneckii TaxID=91943 RepID=A0A3M7IHH6_HORWE|nr:acid phosphatase phoa [Hortaea werneckii]KAI7270693.1 acid phosphatase phoa [Hortaea werneckii]KAI7401116.1 acid phosphatase phoa [Hortaea werneckii]KAI7443223.1 acid phosphatase phoa [Hortaea werneckii]RMZ24904.1 hypothetical protein D0859_11039 [Hortaea werneckii]